MKTLICVIVIFIASSGSLYAQSIDYNKVILPDLITSTSFEEKLIQLAWANHPSNKIVLENVTIAEKERAIASWSWLDNIYAVGNLNEFTIERTNIDRQIFYPKYNFGVRLSLGTFFKTPMEAHLAESRMINAQHSVNEKKLTLRAEVLIQLERFKETFQILILRKNLKEEYYQTYKNMENKFQLNEITLDKLQTSQESYVLQAQDMITAKSKFNQEKLALEALLGLKLEEIAGYTEFIGQLENEFRQ